MEKSVTKDNAKSEIQNFFYGTNVFLTGATGIVGQVLMEKLLRSCMLNKLYLLVRKKKNKSPETRVTGLFSVPLFDRLKEEQPEFIEKIVLVVGDCESPDLGMSEDDKAILIEHVDIVIHSAATVNFNEPLKRATFINIRSTRDLLILSRRMNALKAFVYVSTAFSNCNQNHIKENIYDNHLDGDTLIRMAETMTDSIMDSITPTFLGTWPNTYTLSKCIAENIVRQYGRDMPICITRPGVVTNTYNEPIPGWASSIIGATGISLGVGLGALRVILADRNIRMSIVPSDKLANLIISSAWSIGLTREKNLIPVYNYVSNNMAPDITIGRIYDQMTAIVIEKKLFSTYQVWYPAGLLYVRSKVLYTLLFASIHCFPAILADIYLRLTNNKLRVLDIYKRVYKVSMLVSPFTLIEYKFDDHNVRNLIERQTNYDRVVFDMDMSKMQWKQYIEHNIRGCLRFILRESEKPKLAVWRRTFVLHYGFIAVMAIVMFYIFINVLAHIFL